MYIVRRTNSFFVLTDEQSRVDLVSTRGVDGSNYINASFIDVRNITFDTMFAKVLCHSRQTRFDVS